MALAELPERASASPLLPRKLMASFFSSKATSSFSTQLSSPKPSHKFSQSMMEVNIENAQAMILKWDLEASSIAKFTSLFQENRAEAKEFVQCIKGLRRAMHFLLSEHSPSNSTMLVRAQNLMQIAMKRLEIEFYQILSTNRNYLDPESVSSRSSRLSRSHSSDSDYAGNIDRSDDEIQEVGESKSEADRLSLQAMSDLGLIADCMISSGYGVECVKIYRIIRRSILEEGLYRLGIESYSSSQINKMHADALEHRIENWLVWVKAAVKTLLHGEKLLCDHVFAASETIKESCFADITKEGATNLFRFPELLTRNKRLSDKIFRLMDMYEAILDLLPDIESIFSFESVSCVKLQALSSMQKLGDSVQGILSEFEASIQKNSSKMIVPGAGMHPLTDSVMNYVSSLANYSGALSDILANSASPMQLPFPESYFENPPENGAQNSNVSVQIAWIVLVLLCKLDAKSELYNDIALSYLFLANNLQFVVEKVRSTALKFLLGDEWVEKLDRKVKLYAASYESVAWAKVLSCLPDKPLAGLAAELVKEHLKQFNATFEEAYGKQMSWVAPDAKLRNDIKVSIARKLIPAYREFYDAHVTALNGERNLEELVRFSPDNLGNYLSDLLHGSTVPRNPSITNSRASRCLLYGYQKRSMKNP